MMYTNPVVLLTDSGATFRCIVSNAAGTVTSNPALLRVLAPPSITTQPANKTVNDGQPATFTIAATGTQPLFYQWQRNNTNLIGATTTSYTISPAVFSDSGATFRCIVSNALGTITSNSAILHVNPVPPAVILQPHISHSFHRCHIRYVLRKEGYDFPER